MTVNGKGASHDSAFPLEALRKCEIPMFSCVSYFD